MQLLTMVQDTANQALGTAYVGSIDSVEGQQNALNIAGFGPLVVDGKFGPKTIAAVKAFQQSRGLQVDGKVGPATKLALVTAMLAVNGLSDTDLTATVANATGVAAGVAAAAAAAEKRAPDSPSAPIAPSPTDIAKAQAAAPAVPSLSPPSGYVPIENVSYFTGITSDPQKMLILGGVVTAVLVAGLVVIKVTKKPKRANPRRRRRSRR